MRRPGSGSELGRRQVVLAGSLVALELIAGMQAYLAKTILPVLATDLDAGAFYGVITGIGQMATLVGIPIGAALVRRYPIPRLLMVFTVALCAGAVASAAAPNLPAFLAGQALRSLAGGCLAAISISAVAVGLAARARRITLALLQASWIVSSVLGPAYAAAVTQVLSWRWAMVLYLPLLIGCRWLVARQLRQHTPSRTGGLPIGFALLLGAGLGLTITPVPDALKVITVLAGVGVMVVAATRVLPAGSFTGRSPRHRLIAFLFCLVGTYFAADALLPLTAHDRLGLDIGALGVIVMAGGLAWALVGLGCGLRPARTAAAFRRRAALAVVLIALGCAAVVGQLVGFGPPPLPVLVLAWAVAGCGIGLVYVDILNRLFEQPETPDGLDAETVAGAAVMAESIAVAITTTLVTTWISTGFGLPLAAEARHEIGWAALAVASLGCLAPLLRRGRLQAASGFGQ